MPRLNFRILGCGSSGGVPRLGGHWGECDPNNPKNYRRRCSMLVERSTSDGVTRVLIDTSPDLRTQLLDANVGALSAVLFTHSHADHMHGLDDLRMIVFNMRQRLTVWADKATGDSLIKRFNYAFFQPDGSPYPPILDLKLISLSFVSFTLILALGIWFTSNSYKLFKTPDDSIAKKLMMSSLIYLPFMQLIFVVDKWVIIWFF